MRTTRSLPGNWRLRHILLRNDRLIRRLPTSPATNKHKKAEQLASQNVFCAFCAFLWLKHRGYSFAEVIAFRRLWDTREFGKVFDVQTSLCPACSI